MATLRFIIQSRPLPFLNKMQNLTLSVLLNSHPSFPSKGGPGIESYAASWRFLRTALPRPFCHPYTTGEDVFSGRNRPEQLFSGARGYRRTRRRSLALKEPLPEKEMELYVQIGIEEELPEDDENVLNIAEILREDVPRATKLALDRLKDSSSATRDTSIDNVFSFDNVELSILLCNDNFIRKLNKEWRDKDAATDVLSMSQHIPEFQTPILMLGDIVISIETAARQAAERGQTLLDEIHILMVHGLLHLLGYDHELSEEAEKEMEKEEECILSELGWKGKGLIHSTYEILVEDSKPTSTIEGTNESDTRRTPHGEFIRGFFPTTCDATAIDIHHQASGDFTVTMNIRGVVCCVQMSAIVPVQFSSTYLWICMGTYPERRLSFPTSKRSWFCDSSPHTSRQFGTMTFSVLFFS